MPSWNPKYFHIGSLLPDPKGPILEREISRSALCRRRRFHDHTFLYWVCFRSYHGFSHSNFIKEVFKSNIHHIYNYECSNHIARNTTCLDGYHWRCSFCEPLSIMQPNSTQKYLPNKTLHPTESSCAARFSGDLNHSNTVEYTATIRR